jgi:L-lysine 2,3-aminomutase
MSEAENPDLLAGAHRVTVEDVRALAGASTPHFALQVRNRIRRLIEPLPADDPARREGERKIAELEELAEHSGDPRGTTGIGHG